MPGATERDGGVCTPTATKYHFPPRQCHPPPLLPLAPDTVKDERRGREGRLRSPVYVPYHYHSHLPPRNAMPTQMDSAVGGRPFQRLKSVLRGTPRTSILVTSKDAQRNLPPPAPSDAASLGVLSLEGGVYEAPTTEDALPPHSSPLAPFEDSPTLRQERLSTSSRDRSRRLSSLGMSKVKALLNSSSSPGVSSPPSPRSRRSTSERTLTEFASRDRSQTHLDEDQQSTIETACNSTILQLLPSDHSDGVYRPGDCLTGIVTLGASPNGDRRVLSVKSTLRGVREW